MLERMIRSPFTMLFILTVVVVFITFIHYYPLPFANYEDVLIVGVLLLVAFFMLLIVIHNKRHPRRKIKFDTVIPYEFKEEDEGLQWVTFQACRKVYMFYYFTIPVGIFVIAGFKEYPIVPIMVLFFMGASQYMIYWWEERKYFKDGEEESE